MARAYDVGTANHPWGGMATSTGASGGASHPGPLLFDLLAPLVRWLGIQHAASNFNPHHWLFVVGGLLLLVMLAMPGGLIGLVARRRPGP